MIEYNNQRVLDMIADMSVEEKLLCLHGQRWDPYRANQAGFIRGNERLGIPDFFIADGESGVNISFQTTVFPSKVSLASTFDRDCAFDYGQALGREAKASGIHLLLTPRVNIVRDPVSLKGTSNGGNYQTYSEDPVLNGELGAQEARGIQDDHQALANLKQMFASSTGAAQGAGNCVLDQQTIHELYMRPYELVMRAGVASGMTNYNQINGTWTYDYGHMMKECAREQWGFKGFIFDDWFCLYDPNAIRHGVTLEMPGADYYNEGSKLSLYGQRLLDAVEDPAQPVTMEDVDHAVYYYLDTLDRFGMLDEPQRIPGNMDSATKAKGVETSRRLAEKGAVLLKNEDHMLPLSLEGRKIALIGPGGGRYQAMPTFKESSYGFNDRRIGMYPLLREQLGDRVTYAPGDDLDGEIIPSACLRPTLDSEEHGLYRYTAPFTYETLCNGDMEDCPRGEHFVLDPCIDFDENHPLPVLDQPEREKFTHEPPLNYYMWHGYLTPTETGMHRLSLQSKFPDVEAFERNHIGNSDVGFNTSGNLYLRKAGSSDCLERIGLGIRVVDNGVVNPFSEVVPCADGWNNAGGELYLEAGQTYEVYFNHACLHKEPLSLRLAWTTPSMYRRALEEAERTAAQADVAIVFAWHQSVNVKLGLEENQDELIHRVAAANPNTVVVLNNGDPIEMPWQDEVKAILEMWFPGQEGTRATLAVLTGEVNPGGRLPITFPRKLEDLAARDPDHPERCAPSGRIEEKDAVHPNTAYFTEGLLNGYRWFDETGKEPLYPFGYGLSYTSFAYEDLRVRAVEGGYEALCTVRNTGDRRGDEVAQCYLGRPERVPEGIRTVPQLLADFRRVTLEPGEETTVRFFIEERYLQYYDEKNSGYRTFTGPRQVRVGASSRDIRLTRTITV